MNRKNLIISAVVVMVFCFLYSCSSGGAKSDVPIDTVAVKDSLIKRGGYLVSLVGCKVCHSPSVMTPLGPVADSTRLFSGYDSRVPVKLLDLKDMPKNDMTENNQIYYGYWGVSFAANISSDDTGIGNWSESQFKKAMVDGKYMGIDEERNILPPMRKFAEMSDYDVKAIFAYLKATKPVRNIVPAHIPAVNK